MLQDGAVRESGAYRLWVSVCEGLSGRLEGEIFEAEEFEAIMNPRAHPRFGRKPGEESGHHVRRQGPPSHKPRT